ncbi:MAG TPA: amidohydrolase family protein [Pyrinomonadaceae bacterium]|jgi:imidazolonepropionase-like amidohydrolase|nr:amidohydrolase family protein [Pyrinomonadaceae bacterium]
MRVRNSITAVICLCALYGASLPGTIDVRAQQSGGGAAAQQSGGARPAVTYAIRNARIVTASGPEIENGTLVIRDGKIEAVGPGVSIPPGAQEIDARGLSVYPGMMDAGTSLGLTEIDGGAPGTVDIGEVGDMNPNAAAINAVNPHSAHVNVTRANGITSVVTMPLGGIISGQAAIINLDGSTVPEMAIVPSAALVVEFPRAATSTDDGSYFEPPTEVPITEAVTTRDRQIERLRKLLRDAEAYGRAQDAYARDQKLPRPAQSVVLASLVPFVRGERPVLFRADRELEIRAAVRFADELHLRAVILGGGEAWKAAPLLKERGVPVIVTGVLDLPSLEDDYYDVLYANPAKLQQAGVRFCISSGSTGSAVRNLPYHAGMAAAFGLPREEALRAVTLYPAQIMGVADRFGSIETGKVANLAITDGDLLDARTHVRYLFINGRQVPLTSRHTELYDQFKNR